MMSRIEAGAPAVAGIARRRAALGLALALLLLASACRQDMQNQPKAKPLGPSEFFPDRRASRALPAGTVSRAPLREDRVLETGIGADGKFTREIPVPVSRGLLDRGRDRFNVFCTPCH